MSENSGCPVSHTPSVAGGPSTRWPDDKEWDGAPGVWPRPTTKYCDDPARPAQFISAAPDEFYDCDGGRIKRCYHEFLCTVCGDPIATSPDGYGWLLGKSPIAGACCTRCAWLSLQACPSLDKGQGIAIIRVSAQADYEWDYPGDDGNDIGIVAATASAVPATLAELTEAVKARTGPVQVPSANAV